MSENVSQLPSKNTTKRLLECRNLQEAFQTDELRRLVREAAPKHLDEGSILRTWIQAATRQPLIYQADLRQALGAFQSLAYLGLVPNTALNQAHVIPFKNRRWNVATRQREEVVELQVIIGYQGYIDLADRAQIIGARHADVVYDPRIEGFDFSYGTNQHLDHHGRPPGFVPKENADPAYAYFWARMVVDKSDQFEVMTWHEIETIRNRSQAYRAALAAFNEARDQGKRLPPIWTEAPWVRHRDEMAKKTPARRFFKWVSKSPELRAATALEDRQEHHRVDFGPVIEGTMTPFDDLPEMEDAPEPVDPGTAHADRREPPAAAPNPPVRERAKRTPRAKASEPPPAEEPAGFSANMVNEQGEILGERYTDPVRFVTELLAYSRQLNDDDATAVLDANADALKAAEEDPEASALLRGEAQEKEPEDQPLPFEEDPDQQMAEGMAKEIEAMGSDMAARQEFDRWVRSKRVRDIMDRWRKGNRTLFDIVDIAAKKKNEALPRE
jgi:recombination protein RecT